MALHEHIWNAICQNESDEEIEAQKVYIVLRILMDPIKLDVDETADILVDLIGRASKEKVRKLILNFRPMATNK